MALVVKNSPVNAEGYKRCRFDPWVGKIPRRRAWQPTPIFLLGESHGQRRLVGYSLQCLTESETTSNLASMDGLQGHYAK